MAIPVSSVVNVSISTSPTFPSRAGFGTLNCVTSEEGVIDKDVRIKTYGTIEEVAEDWNSDSEAYKMANTYFSQNPRPTVLKISYRELARDEVPAASGVLTGSEQITPAGLPGDGSFKISIDGQEEELTGLDFTTATSGADIALVIETALQAIATGGFTGATCIDDIASILPTSQFIITSGTTGASSTVTYISSISPAIGTDISSILGLTAIEGATTLDGSDLLPALDGETLTDALNDMQDKDQDWYGLSLSKEYRDLFEVDSVNQVDEAALWCEARIKVFGNTANSVDLLDPQSVTDIATLLKAKTLKRTITTYSSTINEYPSVSVLARAFTTNFAIENSTITLKFKQLPTITVEQLKTSEKSSLDGKNANAYISVGGNSMYAESFMADGTFFDEVHGIDWLQNAIETNVFGYLYASVTKIPYTDRGTTGIEQQLISALEEAVNNGLIGAGETIDGVFLANGYSTSLIAVADVDQSSKDARHYAGVSFVALLTGAIHSVQINGTMER